MSAPAPSRLLACADDSRRTTLLGQSARHGIDYLEVTTSNQLTLEVHLIPDPGAAAFAASLDGRTDKVRISGGERMRGIVLTDVSQKATGSDTIVVQVDRTGDFSTYTLAIDDAAMDPAYAEVDFTFKAGCPARFDCAPARDCAEPVLEEPPIDYMAKDYASFRRALLDFLPTRVPGFDEEHAADLSVSLVELLAYVGDLLSWEQDAVATEAFLATARRRTSVRRHARLVDYRMHDGTSARTWVYAHLTAGQGTGLVRAGTQVLTRLTVPVGQAPPPHPAVLVPARPEDAEAARAAAAAVFEVVEEAHLAEQLNELPVHTWGDGDCCLPTGSTAAHLRGDVAFVAGDAARSAPWRLRPGYRVLLEEIAGPVTGLAADADPAHRQVVTLTRVERARDDLLGLALTSVEWAQDDALRFPLCVSVVDEPGTAPRRVSVARGNLMLADHGASQPPEWHPENPGWTGPPLPAPPGPGIEVGEHAFELTLAEGPVARRVLLPAGAPASALETVPDPGKAVPQVSLQIGLTPGTVEGWSPAPDGLFDVDGFFPAFVVETDDDGRATLRFGDGIYGAVPPGGAYIQANYRVGVGSTGNVGAGALAHLLQGTTPLPVLDQLRNPLPARGGIDPEPVERVKRTAPDAFRAVRERAVTEADYAEVTERLAMVSHARATFRWTGSWYTVYLAVDPVGGRELAESDRQSILDWVTRFTQTGYDLELEQPRYVPLGLELHVCAKRDQLRPDVEQAVLEALVSKPGGFFDPDRISFGDPLYLSQVAAAVEAVPGVDSVTPLRFARLYEDDPDPGRPATAAHLDRGLIEADRLEVLRLDNDPSRPERGELRLVMGGGS
ncbi:MAG TPA: putative baseplate assembly protein [Thermoleophilaceae bacterium]|nr:putative baseplate assembly protein [Thermoleophilaceae bacterium]